MKKKLLSLEKEVEPKSKYYLTSNLQLLLIPSRSSQAHNTAACFPSNVQRETELGKIHCHLDCLCHHPLREETTKRSVIK